MREDSLSRIKAASASRSVSRERDLTFYGAKFRGFILEILYYLSSNR